MKKTILFLASEIESAVPAQCNNLYKKLQHTLKEKRSTDRFYFYKWDQPTGGELMISLEERPEYIHFCGHGADDGLIQVFSEDGRIISFKLEDLVKYLERNKRLECLFLGSCNSNKLIEQLKYYADYSIGFKNSPKPESVNKFYEFYYAKLFELGSPFEAFLRTKDFFSAEKSKTAGVQPIFRSRINYVMELLALNDQRQLEEEKIAGLDSSINSARLELESLEGEARSLLFSLLKSHPYHQDVFWFYSTKEKLADDIAKQVKYLADPDDVEYFQSRLFMAFEIFEKILISFEERRQSRKIFSMVLKGQSKEDFISAFKVLGKNEEVQKRPEGFQLLFGDSIQYAIECFSTK